MYLSATVVLSVLASFPLALTQELGPSPTASVGCVPHNDHWDCTGPRTAADVAAPATPTPSTEVATPAEAGDAHMPGGASHGSDDHAASGELPPSPTASVGCVAHGDHWDCEGPATSTASVIPTPVQDAVGSTTPTMTSTQPTTSPFEGGATRMGAVVGAAGGMGLLLAALWI